MTNYHAELSDYFEIGTDLEAYYGMEEFIDKCSYYLQHEEERAAIARNGYKKVQAYTLPLFPSSQCHDECFIFVTRQPFH